MSSRDLAKARRKAMSSGGKKALKIQPSSQPAPRAAAESTPAARPSASAPRVRRAATAAPAVANSTRALALTRRKAMSTRGKVAAGSTDRTRNSDTVSKIQSSTKTSETTKKSKSCGCKSKSDRQNNRIEKPVVAERSRRSRVKRSKNTRQNLNPGRAASLARRKVLSSRGKAGLGTSGMTPAQTVRSANPGLSSRDMARELRSQRSKRGSAGQKKSAPCGRQRPNRKPEQGPAEDQPWKVGSSETSQGQSVTGTLVGRSKDVTGDEASTCRSVTGTEYLGADIFREFCEAEAPKSAMRTGKSATTRGNAVTGNKVSRSQAVTGNEPGTCKSVTGTEYVGAEQSEAYCGMSPPKGPAKIASGETRKGKTVTGNLVLRSGAVTGNETGAGRELTGTAYTQLGEEGAPQKVGVSNTLRGGEVTGTMVGRLKKMTGDEMGSCRNVTGDDYVGMEQFSDFCLSSPNRTDRKVYLSETIAGESITGSITGRSGRVTGDEPGTCKAVTGTPYVGSEQYGAFCNKPQIEQATARMHASRSMFGAAMTGIQPAVGGKMTGDNKGACEPVSGTPYIGSDQVSAVCPTNPSEVGSSDFPQSLGDQPWGRFSMTPPNHATKGEEHASQVTGNNYEQRQITGPFGMATGMVTGTDDFRFGRIEDRQKIEVRENIQEDQAMVDGRLKTRVTGEGIDAGQKITGDDWDRGERVTGTEGKSATRRNPTFRGGPISAMAPLRVGSRNEELPVPISNVTGSSGNTDQGSFVTYSGGARG